MRRVSRSVRRTYGLVRNAGIGVLVAGGLLAALFPGQIKSALETVLEGLRPERVAPQPAPEPEPAMPDVTAPPPPSPPPSPVRPPPPPVPTGPPRIAVVGIGDARVADRIGSLLLDALRQEGLPNVESGGNSLKIRDVVDSYRGSPPASQVAAALERDGYTALVLGEGVEVASRQLTFYGRKDIATKWRVRVSAYQLRAGRGIGSGWGGEVETTERGALSSLEHFLRPIASQVAPAVEASLGGS